MPGWFADAIHSFDGRPFLIFYFFDSRIFLSGLVRTIYDILALSGVIVIPSLVVFSLHISCFRSDISVR